MKVELELNEASLLGEVAERLTAHVHEQVEAELHRRVRDVVEEQIAELARERLSAELDKVLAEGWRKTNSYGEPTGDRVTLSTWVRDYLTKSNSSRSPVDDAFREVVDRELKAETGKLLEAARERLRGMIDKTIADKLRGVVADAFKP